MKYGLFLSVLLFGSAPCALVAAPQTKTQTDIQDAQDKKVERITIRYRQAYRGDVPASSLPQAITTFDQQTLEDIGAKGLQHALDFSSSIARQNNSGGMWDSFSLRGFPGNENMPSGYLINGFSGGRGFNGPRDTASVDYIEVLKGPGSALYGRSEPGGSVNIVTKKPQPLTSGYIKADYGSDRYRRWEGDITGSLNQVLTGRLIGVLTDSDSYRDYVNKKHQSVIPSLRWQVSDNTSVLYEFEWQKREQLFDRGVVVLNNDFDTVSRSRYLGEPSDGPMRIYAFGHQLTFEHYFANEWTLTGGINHRHSTLKGYSSDTELSPSRQSLYDDGRTLTRQHRYRDYSAEDNSLRLELSGTIATGFIKHHLLIGADAYRYKLKTALSRYRGGKGSYDIDIFNPVYGTQAPPEVSPLNDNHEDQHAVGAYIQDQLDITERWQALLGLRVDSIHQRIAEDVAGTYSARQLHQLSPRFGLVYKASDNLSFYSSYSEGFLPLTGTDAHGQPFGSEESRSFEVGSKWQSDSIQATLALFEAHKSNILVSDPINVGYSAPLGSAKSRGVELDLNYISPWFDVDLSYSYLDTSTDKDSVNADWGVPIPKGSPLVNIPRHNLSLMVSHDFYIADHYLRTGASYRFVDNRLGDAADLSFRLPAYQTYGLFARWQLSEAMTLALNIDNLFDKDYVDSSYNALWVYPGEPRNIKMSATYAF